MIDVKNLQVRMGNFLLRDINLEAGDRECLTIIGPNGSGKTTILESIAGLVKPQSGQIRINDIDATYLPPEKRGIGYVPQDYMLFPHLTTEENVAFGIEENNNHQRMDEAWDIMRWIEIDQLAGRNVKTLSSGEKQKVALARALAIKPKALLLDEPLSALDPLARKKLQRELKRMVARVLMKMNLPVIYVTHDLSEAQLMGDSVAVLNNGVIEQTGATDEVFENPASEFAAEFLGFNVLRGHVTSMDDRSVSVDFGEVALRTEANNVEIGEDVILALKPHDIVLSPLDDASKHRMQNCQCNVIKGKVAGIVKTGSLARITIDAGIIIESEANMNSLDETKIKMGSLLNVQVSTRKTKLIRSTPRRSRDPSP